MDEWYHVTPLFLLGAILQRGGLRAGSALEGDGLPRRRTSREDDSQVVAALDGARPADCVMLFTNPNPPLLGDKTQSRGRWKAYPHVVIHFPAPYCMTSAGGRVFGSIGNVGRTLRDGEEPNISNYTSYIALDHAGVTEVLIHAEALAGGTLSIAGASAIRCFSPTDQGIVERLLSVFGVQVAASLHGGAAFVQNYVEAQGKPPASEHIAMTKSLYEALESKDEQQYESLMSELARRCFD